MYFFRMLIVSMILPPWMAYSLFFPIKMIILRWRIFFKLSWSCSGFFIRGTQFLLIIAKLIAKMWCTFSQKNPLILPKKSQIVFANLYTKISIAACLSYMLAKYFNLTNKWATTLPNLSTYLWITKTPSPNIFPYLRFCFFYIVKPFVGNNFWKLHKNNLFKSF